MPKIYPLLSRIIKKNKTIIEISSTAKEKQNDSNFEKQFAVTNDSSLEIIPSPPEVCNKGKICDKRWT